MRRGIALLAAMAGGMIVFRCLPRDSRDHLTSLMRHRIIKAMEHMLASLPEDAPPKLIMSVLPKLRAQNDKIMAMLQEQNELLRAQQHTNR